MAYSHTHAGTNTRARARTHTHIRTHAATLTHMRTRQTCFKEPSVPRENTVISGISKLKRWPVLEVQYLGSESIRLKKPTGF